MRQEQNTPIKAKKPSYLTAECSPDSSGIYSVPGHCASPRHPLASQVLISPKKLMAKGRFQFIQQTAAAHTSKGIPLFDLSQAIEEDGWHQDENGKLQDAIHVVKIGDVFVNIDNRRPLACLADDTHSRAYAIVHNPSDPLPKALQKRFSTKDKKARVWQDAITYRAAGNTTRKAPSSELPKLRTKDSALLDRYKGAQETVGFYESKAKTLRGMR